MSNEPNIYPDHIYLDSNLNLTSDNTGHEYISLELHHQECDRLMQLYQDATQKLKKKRHKTTGVVL